MSLKPEAGRVLLNYGRKSANFAVLCYILYIKKIFFEAAASSLIRFGRPPHIIRFFRDDTVASKMLKYGGLFPVTAHH